ISTHRLEELAGFLDSLLRNKELLGSLSTDSRKAIRNAVDRSLDLSRSLNMSISVTGLSLIGNNSLAQLSCLSGYLDHSSIGDVSGSVGGGQKKNAAGGNDDAEEYDKENRIANVKGQGQGFGGLNQTKQMIESLRAENKALRGELMEHQQQQQRPRRRESKERKSVPIEPISDSEAWSEPDRGVSLARIGLEDSKLALRQKNASAGTIGAMNLSASGVLELSSTSDNESLACPGVAQRKSGSAVEMKHLQDVVASLSKDLQDKNGTILTIQSQLVDLDSELQRERIRLANVQSEVNDNRQLSERWEREAKESREKAERAAERLVVLESDIRQRDALIEKLRKEREQAAVDLRVAVMKLESMHTEYSDLQQRHKRDLDARLANEQRQLDELRQSLTESFRNELQLKQQSFDTALAQNYISKNIHQEKVRELNELHYRLEDAHNDISTMAQAEDALRKQLADCERNVQAMKKSLDEATLQASKAAIERTKALNEKRQLESELGYVQDELKQLKVEKNELNEQLQAAMMLVRSPQNSRSPRTVTAAGNLSTSGTDEETTGRRQLENSSPDLGIESDPGRLSNVELGASGLGGELKYATSPQQRPLLKTLELTKSMSNLLLNPAQDVKLEDGESSKVGGGVGEQDASAEATTIVKHDCAKIEVDYRDLQRRYNKTRQCLAVAYDKIKSSNKVKKQLEVDLKQQIHKTHAVLKTVHRNMDTNGGAGGSNDD
uniref:Uncharacterized protein n=1 Tax=Anopheles maculatus TaxID=74869 RepID=A0A182SEF7_9DIPT